MISDLLMTKKVEKAENLEKLKDFTEKMGDEGVEKQRDLLSLHKTNAEFQGKKELQCRHMTMLCPDQCGHGGTIASFKIKE